MTRLGSLLLNQNQMSSETLILHLQVHLVFDHRPESAAITRLAFYQVNHLSDTFQAFLDGLCYSLPYLFFQIPVALSYFVDMTTSQSPKHIIFRLIRIGSGSNKG